MRDLSIGRQLEEVRMSLGNTPLSQMQTNKTGRFKDTVTWDWHVKVLGIKLVLRIYVIVVCVVSGGDTKTVAKKPVIRDVFVFKTFYYNEY